VDCPEVSGEPANLYKNKKPFSFLKGFGSSGDWTRTSDLRVMSLEKLNVLGIFNAFLIKTVYGTVYSDLTLHSFKYKDF
jgi:hypothetical protein